MVSAFKEQLLGLYPNYDKLFGPYVSKEGRAYFVLVYKGENRNRKTILRARAVMEVSLGRLLQPTETVDHKNRNKLDDTVDNLQIMTKKENSAKSAVRRVETQVFCINCGRAFTPSTRQKSKAKSITGAGPFCGRKCTGQYGALVRYTNTFLPRVREGVVFYTRDLGVVKVTNKDITNISQKSGRVKPVQKPCSLCGKSCRSRSGICMGCYDPLHRNRSNSKS